MTPAEYFKQMLPYARSVSERIGIDPRLVLAQSALETGYGKSAPGMNYFGIKGQGQSLPTTEFENGSITNTTADFRTYENPMQSFQDYASLLLNNSRYDPVLAAKTLEEQIAAMGQSGYATDPGYASKLQNIASKIDLDDPSHIADETLRSLGLLSTPEFELPNERSRAEKRNAMTPQQQRGGGLLEMFGLQKMQAGAQGETGQKFYERDRFKDFSGTMANWLNSMTLNPDPNLAANMDAGKQRRTANKSRNRTVDMLTQRAESGDAVAAAVLGALNTGAITAKDAISTYLSQTLTDPKTQSQMFKRVMDARKEFSGRAEAKGFSEVSFAYGRIASSIQGGPTAAGDLSLIFNFMKMLDPGSVVRESEFSAAASAGSYGERIKALVGSIEDGTLLSAAQRADFVARATGLYNSAQGQYDKVANQYRDFAVQAGLDPNLVVPDISYAGELLKRPTILDVPPRPTTGAAATSFPTDEAWQKHWREGFTEQQRKDYLQALGN